MMENHHNKSATQHNKCYRTIRSGLSEVFIMAALAFAILILLLLVLVGLSVSLNHGHNTANTISALVATLLSKNSFSLAFGGVFFIRIAVLAVSENKKFRAIKSHWGRHD